MSCIREQKQANKLTKHAAPPGALAADSQQCTPPPHTWGGWQDPGSQSLTQPHLSLQGQSAHSFPLSLSLPFFPLPLSLLLSLHLSGSGSVSSFLHIFLHLQHPTPYPGGGESCFFTPLQNSWPRQDLWTWTQSRIPSSFQLVALFRPTPPLPPYPKLKPTEPSVWTKRVLMAPTHTHIPHLQGHVNLQGLFWEPPPGICKGAGAGLSLHRTRPLPLRG